MRNIRFDKLDDFGIDKLDEQSNSEYLAPNDKEPEFDEIGTALNEI